MSALAQAEADVSPIVAHLQKTYPTTNGAIGGGHVEEWHRTLVSKARPALLLLQGVAAFVLLVACANLANLFLVAAVRREREFAVRAALGGSRARLARQVLFEGALMALAGGTAGLLLALWARGSMLAVAPADWRVAAPHATLDWRLLVFTTIVTSLATLACSSFPAGGWRCTNPAIAFKARVVTMVHPWVGCAARSRRHRGRARDGARHDHGPVITRASRRLQSRRPRLSRAITS